MNNKVLIGKIIKNKRLELNLRMDDLAKEVGITRSTLSAIENGNGNYTIDALLNTMNHLGLDLNIISDKRDITRSRATRRNTAIDKKINRFIIMCVEQYASSVEEASAEVYLRMNKNGVIKELADDYEDMHGMSTEFLNDHIYKRLGNTRSTNAITMNHVLSKTILISRIIELIADKYKLTLDEARDDFYKSEILELLEDDETGLYGESALYIMSLYTARKKKKK